MNRSILERGGNVLALLVTLAVNGMANGIPLGGQTTGEISDKYPSLFTPAGYVFSIWGLIYLGLILFVVWQALPTQKTNRTLSRIHPPFLASCLCNALWIFAWHYDLLAMSLAVMFGLLTSLIIIYRRLDIGWSKAKASERWILHLPISIYLGWVTVATLANISAIQVDWGWDNRGLEATTWTSVKLALAAAIASWMVLRRHDIAFMLVVVWACVGIVGKHTDVQHVAGAASVVSILGILLVLMELAGRGRSHAERDPTLPR